jgi:hypothetical protein
MTSSYDFSAAYVVMILAGVALLAVASALTVAPFDKFDRPRGMLFLVCTVVIWAVALLVIWLIKRTI